MVFCVNWEICKEKMRDFRLNGGFEKTHYFLVKWGIFVEKTRDFHLHGGFLMRNHVIFGLNEGFAKRKRVIFA